MAYGGLRFIGHSPNNKITVHESESLPFADIVAVDAGSAYFFTWGVTASPRFQNIARTGTNDRYGDTYQQSKAVLSQLTVDLAEVGLTLRDVVNVRAYVVADPEPDFAGWNRAFTEFFGTKTNPHKPARTSVGISRLFLSSYRIEVEFIAAFPDGRGPHVVNSRQHERYARLGRIETSDRWKSYGRPVWPMSTGKATEANTGMFFSSALRPQTLIPNAPPQFQIFGNITQQSASLFKQMSAQLQEASLGFEDVFFIRAMVYPGKDSISQSFAAFNQEYLKYFNNKKNPNRPTRTVMSVPGFDYKKQSISIEYYAAYPRDSAVTFETAQYPIGSSSSIAKPGTLGPAGTAVSPAAKLLFVSGAISAEEGEMTTQAAAALAVVGRSLATAGASFHDITHLRVYIEKADSKTTDQRIADWESIYAQTFPAESAPAITVLPVVSLVNGSMLEIEAMAVISSD